MAAAKSPGEKYRGRPRRSPSPAWRAFRTTHRPEIIALDCFPVPTVSFPVLCVLLVLAHDRRRILHFTVTAQPTAQPLVAASPWTPAPRWLLRDRDAVSGPAFAWRVTGVGLPHVLTAPRSPWQNPSAERVIGSIRRECVDPVMGFSEEHGRRILARYVAD